MGTGYYGILFVRDVVLLVRKTPICWTICHRPGNRVQPRWDPQFVQILRHRPAGRTQCSRASSVFGTTMKNIGGEERGLDLVEDSCWRLERRRTGAASVQTNNDYAPRGTRWRRSASQGMAKPTGKDNAERKERDSERKNGPATGGNGSGEGPRVSMKHYTVEAIPAYGGRRRRQRARSHTSGIKHQRRTTHSKKNRQNDDSGACAVGEDGYQRERWIKNLKVIHQNGVVWNAKGRRNREGRRIEE
ncbi:unnamed protein product, partial [Pleuronectes platessa]